MTKRYRERARLHSISEILNRPNCLHWYLAKLKGIQLNDDNQRVAKAKRGRAHQLLLRRVYQTGEYWLLTDPYERSQAESYFTIMESSDDFCIRRWGEPVLHV